MGAYYPDFTVFGQGRPILINNLPSNKTTKKNMLKLHAFMC